MDKELAEWFGLCVHKWEMESRTDYVYQYKCAICGKSEILMVGGKLIACPDFTAQITIDGEPQSLLVHHLRLKGELEGFLKWHYEQTEHCYDQDPEMDLLMWRNKYSETLLTPTLLRQAVYAYMKWRESNGS